MAISRVPQITDRSVWMSIKLLMVLAGADILANVMRFAFSSNGSILGARRATRPNLHHLIMNEVVTGIGVDDTITVLSASGPERDGDVLLRIDVTVEQSGGSASTYRAVGCFDYELKYFTSPNEVSCPDLPPLRLPPPGSSTTTTVS